MSNKDFEDFKKKHKLNTNRKLSSQELMNILGDFMALQSKELKEASKELHRKYPELLGRKKKC